jgi:hypothetical protein
MPKKGGREMAGGHGKFFFFCLRESVGDFGKQGCYRRRNILTGNQLERACSKHGAGKVFHEREGLEMQVSKHDIGAPATNQLDYTGIDAAAE